MVDFNTFSRIIGLFKTSKWISLLILIFLSFVFESLGIALIFPVIDILTSDDMLNNYQFLIVFYPGLEYLSRSQLVLLFISFFALFFFIRTIYLIFFNIYKISLITKLRIKLTNKCFENYLFKDFIFFKKNNSSDIIRNLTSECSYAVNLINHLITLIVEGLIVLGLLTLLVFTNSLVSLLLLGIFGTIFFIVRHFTKTKMSFYSKQRLESASKQLNIINEFINGINEIIINKKRNFFEKYFKKHNKIVNDSAKFIQSIQQIPRYLIELSVVIFICFMLYNAALSPNSFQELLPFLGLFTVSILRMLPSVNRIILALQSLKFGIPAIVEVNKILTSYDYKMRFNENSNKKLTFSEKIFIKDLSFSYDNEELINIKELVIPKREITIIVGENGSGKSTLVNILTGLIKPPKGSVFIDKIDLSQNISDWQNIISYVPQDAFLIKEKIQTNISLENESEFNQEKFKFIANTLDLQKLINSQSKINDGVDEGGKNFSGGQKQKISIGRSLYKEPEVIFMDEPTNSIDRKTKQNLVDFIVSNKKKITFIIISHDKDLINVCDNKFDLTSIS